MSQIMRPMADCQRESCGARVVRVSGFPALPPRDRLADMKSSLLLVGATLAALILSPIVPAQSPEPGNLLASVDGSDLARQISDAIAHLNQSTKQHPILVCDEAHL